ncbi:Flagellin protein FlaG [Methylophaga frappieri]|jgi:flagellar protein FlaG|uniref:Flagellin protein FlaG n=1 Tax=Methylophaga frappieri (strain ATCC BAA-2434 / DSM 25690 / JAM7) TaxID=754477 RepID=I1YKN0_METFJ|nr:flagellar protein FlaG [Methylophaga frappieri]AFJ03473.1 Flagellin protein FlaG [Methylophaga frappieri]
MDINNLSSLPPAGQKTSGDLALKVDNRAAEAGTDVASIQATSQSAQAGGTQSENAAQEVSQAVSQINDYVQNMQRSLQFSVDELSGRNVVTVIDKETEEVIRQIPSEEVLSIARSIASQFDDGLSLFNSQA